MWLWSTSHHPTAGLFLALLLALPLPQATPKAPKDGHLILVRNARLVVESHLGQSTDILKSEVKLDKELQAFSFSEAPYQR